MICLHALKMDSEPSESSKHALWKGMLSSQCYLLLIQILSIGLIGFGVSYKVILHKIFHSATTGADENEHYSDDAYSTYHLSYPFLCVVLVSMELIKLSHSGLKTAIENHYRKSEGKQKLNWPVVIVTLIKWVIILNSAVYFKYLDTSEPIIAVIIGLLTVVAILACRTLNRSFVEKAKLAEAQDAGNELVGQDFGESNISTQHAENMKVDFATAMEVEGIPSVEEEGREVKQEEDVQLNPPNSTPFPSLELGPP